MKITIRKWKKDNSRLEADVMLNGSFRRRYVIPLNVYQHLKESDREKACSKWAERKALTALGESQKPKPQADPNSLTVEDFFPLFQTDIQANSPNTVATYERHYRLHLKDRIGGMLLAELTEKELDSLRNQLSQSRCNKGSTNTKKDKKWKHVKEGAKAKQLLAGRSINGILNSVMSMLDRAHRWGYISKVPKCRYLDVPHGEDSQLERSRYYDRKEADAIVKVALVLGLMPYCFVLLGLDGGLRVGEIAALRWENVDFGGGKLSISEAAVTVNRETIIKLPKMNKKGVIGMSQRLQDALTKLYAISSKRGRILQRTQLDAKATRGIWGEGPVTPGLLKYWMEVISTRAALIDPRIKPNKNPHKLRHTCGTRIADETKNVMAVKEHLRHSSINSSLIYMHSEYGSSIKAALDQTGINPLNSGLKLINNKKEVSNG